MATSKINPSGTTKLDTKRIIERGERIREGTEKPWDVLVQESSLYDLKPTMRSILMLLARVRVQGDGPNARPSNPERKALPQGEYENWCWLSQETVAKRVGCTDRYVNSSVRHFEKDDVIEIREWRDDLGHPHLEYKVNILTVKLHERKEGEPRAKRYKAPRKSNAGSFSTTNQPGYHLNSEPLGNSADKSVGSPEATGTVSRDRRELSAVSRVKSQPLANGTVNREPHELGAVVGDVGFGLKVSDGSSGLLLQTTPKGVDSSLRSPSAFGGSSRASHEEQGTTKPTPTAVRGADPVSKPENQNQKQHRDGCKADGCKGKQSPAGTGFCSWHDRERTNKGRKPLTYDQMPVKGMAGLGEELEVYDLETAERFACGDCGRLEGHKPNCPSDPYARADEYEVDVEICSECGVANGSHSRNCSHHRERIALRTSRAAGVAQKSLVVRVPEL